MLTLRKRVLIIGGGPGGRFSYMTLRRMGEKSLSIVMNEDPTVICSLPYGVEENLFQVVLKKKLLIWLTRTVCLLRLSRMLFVVS